MRKKVAVRGNAFCVVNWGGDKICVITQYRNAGVVKTIAARRLAEPVPPSPKNLTLLLYLHGEAIRGGATPSHTLTPHTVVVKNLAPVHFDI